MPHGSPGLAGASRADGLALAAAGGVLYFLGYLGWGVWPCLFVFLVPLWTAIERAPSHAEALGIGMVFGLAAYAGGFGWLWPLVDAFLDGDRLLGAVLWSAYGVWFAAGFALYALAVRRLLARGRSIAVAGIAPLVALEWLQPTLFPVNAGSALVAVPRLVQSADLGGPLLLTALVAGANAALYRTLEWARGSAPRPVAAWIATLALATAVAGYGRVRMTAIDAATDAPVLRVGIVQANLSVAEKRMAGVLSHARHLEQTRELLAGGDVDLVVWPETAYVRGIRRPLPVSGRMILDDLRVPLLFGASSVEEVDGRRVVTNSAFLVGPDGIIRDAYDKNLLIPLTEYVPLSDLMPSLAARIPHASAFGAAQDQTALRLGAWRIATPICYEAVRADFVRRLVVATDPQLLVTLANDAWFGDSAEPWLHLALARLRAVEHRRFLVRATNSGVSAIVDPAGRIVVASGLFTRETLRGLVSLRDDVTLYRRIGDWPGPLAVLCLLWALVRRPTTTNEPSADS